MRQYQYVLTPIAVLAGALQAGGLIVQANPVQSFRIMRIDVNAYVNDGVNLQPCFGSVLIQQANSFLGKPIEFININPLSLGVLFPQFYFQFNEQQTGIDTNVFFDSQNQIVMSLDANWRNAMAANGFLNAIVTITYDMDYTQAKAQSDFDFEIEQAEKLRPKFIQK